MNKSIIATTAIMALATLHPALASGNHAMESKMHGHDMHGDKGTKQMQGGMEGMKGTFLIKKEIDGYTVSFHAMKAKEGMRHGGSHNFMVKIEKDGKPADVAAVNSKATHPDGQSESKMMMKMGDWYMAGYDLDHEGRHQLMVLFKMADGEKHFGGTWYPEE